MTTPGASDTSDDAARFGSGSAASISRVTTWPTDAPCEATAGIDALTVTASSRPATASTMSTVSVSAIDSVMDPRVAGWNPLSLTPT